MTTTKVHEVISNGWKISGVYDSITLGLSKLPALDPYSDKCPFMEVAPPMETQPGFLVSKRALFIPMEER